MAPDLKDHPRDTNTVTPAPALTGLHTRTPVHIAPYSRQHKYYKANTCVCAHVLRRIFIRAVGLYHVIYSIYPSPAHGPMS